MNGLKQFLNTSYTAFHAVENATAMLLQSGFTPLREEEAWDLREGGKYFVVRGGSSIVAFRHAKGPLKIVASHTDSPCLKLKENPCMKGPLFTRLNVETYGGGILYSFFDRPLKLAGRIVRATEDGIRAENYVSGFTVCIPSLAIHMNRTVNDGFAPDRQTDLLPLLGLGERELSDPEGALSFDLFAVPDAEAFVSGLDAEFFSSPRIDNLSSVYASVKAITDETCTGACVAACFDSEEIGSRTGQGAGGDFLKCVLSRLGASLGYSEEERMCRLRSSLFVSLDNAHSVHPNRPEKCDPTNRAVMGGGVVIKGHAEGAYTTDAVTSAVIKKIFTDAGVRFQTFYNRSDMRSGSTLGAISLTQASIPSVDLGIAQLAMHSAVETIAKSDFFELQKGLSAFYSAALSLHGSGAKIGSLRHSEE